MYFLYSTLLALGALLLAPYFLLRGLRQGKYLHNLSERMGHYPHGFARAGENEPGALWIHAVSVGEALAAVPLAQQLKQRLGGRLAVSTTTLTGQRLVRERMDFADMHLYFPLDWTHPVRRAFDAVRPGFIVIVETEIWPNFLREARRRGVPVVVVNGRISQRSFTRYRWANRLTGGFIARVLGGVQLFLMQSDDDARRIVELGAPPERVEVMGNMKYDLTPRESGPVVSWLGEQIERQERWPVVVAGSVLADEEQEVLAAFDLVQRRWCRALLVLAPRKPERFAAAARIVAEDGWNVVRRSTLDRQAPLDEAADVLMLDSVGELAGVYRLADAAFVGGSLVNAGGHNILEPAWFAKPPVFGPSMSNFRDMATEFLLAKAGVCVASGVELGRAWIDLVDDTAKSEAMGRAARSMVERNRGATDRAFAAIVALAESKVAAPRAKAARGEQSP